MKKSNSKFLAHISEDKQREQTILDHSKGTAKLAADFASVFSCKDWGYACGLMHDIGKYSLGFQKRLKGGPRVDHSTAGAKEFYKIRNIMAAYCVCGHHTGLLNGGSRADTSENNSFYGRMQKQVEDYSVFQTELSMPDVSNPPLKPLKKGGFSVSFFIRMLFSCLVDADFLNTETFMTENKSGRETLLDISIDELYQKLLEDIDKKKWREVSDRETVNGRRSMILNACLEQGKQPQGLFTLTVPTGGGKTISSLAFALTHAKEHRLHRVIYAIPYTSIIEQNVEVFRSILGNESVLEDHSNVEYEEEENKEELKKIQLATENWDRPVVVTTNVQFFESLFANKSSKCRKLHNIAGSVIILDEAQMLPEPYLLPCIQALSELIYNYHCSVVLCTATQPSIQKFFPKEIVAKELCPLVLEQYDFFQRVLIEFMGEWSQEELIKQLKKETQALCIVNSRKRAQKIFEELGDSEDHFYLSTLLYPNHRKKQLEKIRTRLKEKKRCILIATSLVEAGVDFDFQTVYRELAGLDSIIQAAGRCNRHGKRSKEESKTKVFTFPDAERNRIAPELRRPISVAKQIIQNHDKFDSIEAIEDYFNRLFYLEGDGLDAKEIIEQFEEGVRSSSYPFQTVAEQFKLIEDKTIPVFIAKDAQAIELLKKFRQGQYTKQLIRKMGQYQVNLYERDYRAFMGAGLLETVIPNFYVLRDLKLYSEETGLDLKVDIGDAIFDEEI